LGGKKRRRGELQMCEKLRVEQITKLPPLDTIVSAGGRKLSFWAYDEAINSLRRGDTITLRETGEVGTPYGDASVRKEKE